jgi:dTDP-4-dehydrorhamnose 3,5-epimerase
MTQSIQKKEFSMDFAATDFKDLYIIKPKIFGDSRGYFFESFRDDLFKKHIGDITFIQDNESKSSYGVLRGLHYQLPPFAQSKLVRVVVGEILDVAVDIRKNSSTFGKHFKIILSDENKLQLFIPKGFAHGFIVLSEFAIVNYKVDALYSPEHERGVDAFDPFLGIDWTVPQEKTLRSPKDSILPQLKDAVLL